MVKFRFSHLKLRR